MRLKDKIGKRQARPFADARASFAEVLPVKVKLEAINREVKTPSLKLSLNALIRENAVLSDLSTVQRDIQLLKGRESVSQYIKDLTHVFRNETGKTRIVIDKTIEVLREVLDQYDQGKISLAESILYNLAESLIPN